MSNPCCICDPRVPNREGWHPYPSDCIDHLKAALAHERDRAKRVVRVFWRVRDSYSGYIFSFTDRKRAFENLKLNRGSGKVYRVTVRRVKR